MDEADSAAEKSLFIFGRDISKIPCFRNSLLYGIGGGIAFGLARFMITSQPLRSTNFAVYSFSLVTIAYWIQCRYTYSKKRFEMLKMQELMKANSLLEGTEADSIHIGAIDTKPVEV
ncbi:unnamed protein product [Acanthoscelides obtectus]|uniref:Cytochrome c oxidase assembly protein COX20, mitochondrial n=1 Tax=Acanthoscelides obtectus TaxID=200917 RepID=A0A9P0KPU8_ACAOB|nr:unnamed protein product [Acanthoscelides obtectus]CAK1634308.1 Cytochrome c oxidase assembly protein COX20, mitochondrial [Acanthoscelides obtectus]